MVVADKRLSMTQADHSNAALGRERIDRSLPRGVERAGALVQHCEGGRAQEKPHDCEPLLLAGREDRACVGIEARSRRGRLPVKLSPALLN